MPEQTPTPARVLRKPQVSARVGLSDSTIYRLEKSGDFPKRIRIGGRAVGWRESDIEQWIKAKTS